LAEPLTRRAPDANQVARHLQDEPFSRAACTANRKLERQIVLANRVL
jgi:hypothetical protein